MHEVHTLLNLSFLQLVIQRLLELSLFVVREFGDVRALGLRTERIHGCVLKKGLQGSRMWDPIQQSMRCCDIDW